mmetsp:Transcript_54252/g.86247  ORF Transcript_54252/g.86247 Transcript_54252/m.86247 type:complete len:499 (-) Transcript_54252:16-1512(-)
MNSDAKKQSIKSIKGNEWKEEEYTSGFLCEAAAIETRLRSHILELLEPTIRKTTILEAKVKENRAALEARQQEMSELRKVKDDAETLMKIVEGFQNEMGEWDKERRHHQAQLTEKAALQEGELNALRHLLEQRNAATGGMERSLKSLGDLVTTARDETTQLRSYAMERIDVNRDKMAKLRDELEQRTTNIENQVHELQDQQTGTNKIVNHMTEAVDSMSQRVCQADANIADLWRSKAAVSCLEEQQQDLHEFMRHVNATVSSLRHQFGTLVDDVKSHFQEAAKVVGTTTSKQIEDMRSQCSAELLRIDEVAEKIERFMRSSSDQQSELKVQVREDHEKAKTELQGLKQSVEKQEKTRHVSDNNVSVELAQLHKGISDLKAHRESEESRSNLRNDIMEMLVESQLLSAYLDQQDDHDRKNIALYGYKSGDSKDNKPSMSCTLPDLGRERAASARTPRKHMASSSGMGGGMHDASEAHVLSLDKRCLSCSGSSTTVMAGF